MEVYIENNSKKKERLQRAIGQWANAAQLSFPSPFNSSPHSQQGQKKNHVNAPK